MEMWWGMADGFDRRIIRWFRDDDWQLASDTDWVIIFDDGEGGEADSPPYTATKRIDPNCPIKGFETLDAAMEYCQRVYDAVNGEDPVSEFIGAINARLRDPTLSNQAYSRLEDIRDDMLMRQNGGR